MIASIDTGNGDVAASRDPSQSHRPALCLTPRIPHRVSANETGRKGANGVTPTPPGGFKSSIARLSRESDASPAPTPRQARAASQNHEHSWVVPDALMRMDLGVVRFVSRRCPATQPFAGQPFTRAPWVIPLGGALALPPRALGVTAEALSRTLARKRADKKRNGTKNAGRRKLEFLCRFLSH